MPTKAQETANQANAQRSTGPRTAEGKHASSQNARTHGLSSLSPATLPDTWRAAFALHVDTLRGQLQPQTAPEESFFQQFAHADFLRAKACERELETLAQAIANPADPHAQLEHARAERYVVNLERRTRSALKQLQELQLNRQLARELERTAQDIVEKEISISSALPLTRLLNPKEMRTSFTDLALRLALEAASQKLESKKNQNEPNSSPSPGETGAE